MTVNTNHRTHPRVRFDSLDSAIEKARDANYDILERAHISSEIVERSIDLKYLKETIWTDCRFASATFSGNDLRGATFDDCDLNVSFHGCNLESAMFKNLRRRRGVFFRHCNLAGADLRELPDCHLDDCYVAGTRLPKGAADSWSILRRTYTGIRAIATLLLLVAFFVPYGIETILWVSLDKLEDVPQVKDYLCARGCSEMSVAALVVGYHHGLISAATAIVLVIYNVMRGYITIQVAPLRENEERCHYTPSSSEFDRLYSMHRFVSTAMVFSVVLFVIHIILWLTAVVSVPKWFLEKSENDGGIDFSKAVESAKELQIKPWRLVR